MASRIKLPFRMGDSKKINEIEITETSKKEDFALTEVSLSASKATTTTTTTI